MVFPLATIGSTVLIPRSTPDTQSIQLVKRCAGLLYTSPPRPSPWLSVSVMLLIFGISQVLSRPRCSFHQHDIHSLTVFASLRRQVHIRRPVVCEDHSSVGLCLSPACTSSFFECTHDLHQVQTCGTEFKLITFGDRILERSVRLRLLQISKPANLFFCKITESHTT